MGTSSTPSIYSSENSPKPSDMGGTDKYEYDDIPPKANWKSLFDFTSPKHIPIIILGVFFALAAALVMPFLSIILGEDFDILESFTKGKAVQPLERVASCCIELVVLGGANWLLSGAYFALFVSFGEKQEENARNRLFSELLRKDLVWFQTQQDGIGAFLSVAQG